MKKTKMVYEIQSDDMPIPVPSGKGGKGPRSKLGDTFQKLKPGEHFTTSANVNTIHSVARYWLGARSIVYRKLSEQDKKELKLQGNVDYHRIWRIK